MGLGWGMGGGAGGGGDGGWIERKGRHLFSLEMRHIINGTPLLRNGSIVAFPRWTKAKSEPFNP